jgi:hypothetical protein
VDSPGRAGFWLYAAGTTTTKAVGQSDTTISVVDTTRFSLKRGLYHNRSDDICLAPLGSDGKPDFTKSEQVVLTGIDSTAGTLTVRRAQ